MYLLFLIFCLSIESESLVMLTPSGEVSVCPGCQLTFRCSTNLQYLGWNITTFHSLTGRIHSRWQLISPVSMGSPLTISGYSFNVTRDSADGSYPLISTLTVPNHVYSLPHSDVTSTSTDMSHSVLPTRSTMESDDNTTSGCTTLTQHAAVSCPTCNEVPALASSMAVFIFTSLLVFVIGFLSGYFTLRFQYKHASSTIYEQSQSTDGQIQNQPLYEAIPGVESQNLELEENAAYSAARLNNQQDLQMGENLAYALVQLGGEDQNLELRANI